ncbi:hypothetical protein CJF30_00010913 [Rutstroemia sp. NJR-2017a BBW]|nr:hypothetical protein CJF30_00010913 [Rutstroemia sp. NJR-2017a BBW]
MAVLNLITHLTEGVKSEFKRGFDPNNDPRVGSSRENSTSSTLSAAATGSNSSSFSSLYSTLIPVAVYAAVCLISFLILRKKYPRVYAPRTLLSSLDVQYVCLFLIPGSRLTKSSERSVELPNGWFNWVKPFFKTPDTAVLNQSSLDGYLFLRFLKIMCVICLVGCFIVFPVLIPLHLHGGGGNSQLDSLNFGNISNGRPNVLYVHALLAWVFFGETPSCNLEERKLRKVFGDAVKHVWIPRESSELEDLVDERNQTAFRLERAETKLIKLANQERNRALKHGHPDIEASVGMNSVKEVHRKSRESTRPEKVEDDNGVVSEGALGSEPPMSPTDTLIGSSSPSKKEARVTEIAMSPTGSRATTSEDSASPATPGPKWGDHGYGMMGPPPDVSGSVASQWIPHSWRPTHRPLSNYGRSVDTIKWTRNRLKELAPQISKLRRNHRQGKGKPLPAAFIEFDTQVNAQSAYQTLSHHRAFHMKPHIYIRPHEIIWDSLRMRWWERIVRGFAIQAFVAATIIFWSIPCALIGVVSNITFLTEKIFFLAWLKHLPAPILGLITGLLPAVALTFLMSLVPYILRACARQAGIPSHSMIELYTQSGYFVFQVVQVFLVTTITSAASAAFEKILENPTSVRSLLSQNLPKASNFYVSYFILQGLAMSASRLLQIGSLIRHLIWQNEQNQRAMINKWHRIKIVHWGAIYPVFTNMGVIAITYSLLAPLTVVFALIGLYLIYLVSKYNLLYTYSSEISTRGLLYPHALKQLLTGLYLAEICLIGLFGLRSAFGPLVLMFGLTIFTALVHISINEALGPLLWNLPRTLAVEELYRGLAVNSALQTPGIQAANPDNGNINSVSSTESPNQLPTADLPFSPNLNLNNGNNNPFVPTESSDPPPAVDLTLSPNPNYAAEDGDGNEQDSDDERFHDSDDEHEPNSTSRGAHPKKVEGLPMLSKLTFNFLKASILTQITPYLHHLEPVTRILTPLVSPVYDPSSPPNFILKFLHPEVFADYHILRSLTAPLPTPSQYNYTKKQHEDAYYPPCVNRSRDPKLWIPKDAAGVSRQECAHTKKIAGIDITDEGVELNEKQRIIVDNVQAENNIWWRETRY